MSQLSMLERSMAQGEDSFTIQLFLISIKFTYVYEKKIIKFTYGFSHDFIFNLLPIIFILDVMMN
jgi:hypothetical protein